MGLFGSSAPPRVETDVVIPVGFLDNTPLQTRILLYTVLVYDEVLEADKLYHALSKLASRDGWRRLGARLRRSNDGGLEFHIPAGFSDSRPAISYTHERRNTRRDDDPLASKLPRAPKPGAGVPTIVGDVDEFLPLAKGPGCPNTVDDYLYHDRPMFGLHICSFDDTTVVTLHWLHVACDGMGHSAIMRNWVRVLEGRDDEIEPAFWSTTDPMADLGKNPTEPHLLDEHRMTTATMAGWAFNNIGDLAWRSKEVRMVCMPAAYVQKLHSTAMSEVKADNKDAFVSTTDILSAWVTRMAVIHTTPSSNPVTMQMVADVRDTLEGELFPKGNVYIGNCYGFVNVLTTLHDVLAKPLSHTASLIRQSLATQRSRAQVEAYYDLSRKVGLGVPVFFGQSNTTQVSFSNWTKSNLFTVDFGAAVVGGKSGRTSCLPSYIHHHPMPLQFGEGYFFMGKDNDGNYWFSAYRSKGMWAHIEKALAAEASQGVE